MSTLDQMQAFVAVVEQGSFTAAALHFNISPTAMCKKIATLEKSLNTRLFIRTPRIIAVTDIGKKYYAQCKKVLHEYQLSNLLLDDKMNHLTGTLHIVCSREIAQSLVYPTMAPFLAQYPHIVTNVTTKKQATDHVIKQADVAMGYEISDAFNDWCYRKLDQLVMYIPNIKPTPLKIQVYIDYITHNWETSDDVRE